MGVPSFWARGAYNHFLVGKYVNINKNVHKFRYLKINSVFISKAILVVPLQENNSGIDK